MEAACILLLENEPEVKKFCSSTPSAGRLPAEAGAVHSTRSAAEPGGQTQYLPIATDQYQNATPGVKGRLHLPCKPFGRSIVFTSSSAMSKAFSPLNFFSQKS